MNLHIRGAGLLLASALVIASAGLAADTPAAVTGGKATITVTAIGKKDTAPPPIADSDVQLTVNKERKQVASWSKSNSLGLAILIDDALLTSAASQWNDLRDFIMAQPASTQIAI